MCGITCVLSKKNDNIIQFIYNSLNLLQNRGYDSVGIAYFLNNSNTIESKKYASSEVVDSLLLLKDNIEEINGAVENTIRDKFNIKIY